MPVKKTINRTLHPVHIWTNDVEFQALNQLVNVAQLPIIAGHVAGMPDVHAGVGATVGSVIPTRKAIIPAAVGVDIGCGMMAIQLSLSADDLPDSLSTVRTEIEKAVPVGFNQHDAGGLRVEGVRRLSDRYEALLKQTPALVKMQKDPSNWAYQIGTLGGGNHFIELCLDESGKVWVMLHSGSRGIGNKIGQHFISVAKEEMLRLDANLPDKNLAYLSEGTQYFNDYIDAVGWAQDYAMENRREMMVLVLAALRKHLPEFTVVDHAINCHHNYVQVEIHFGEEVFITRKGAIRAGIGEKGIIPGSMGAKSFIVSGKGNSQSFCSCSHGAGRRMSRSEAKRRFSEHDLKKQTAGVECRKDAGVIDEIPGAYKDIDEVMDNQTDLVEILHTLRQVLCVKG